VRKKKLLLRKHQRIKRQLLLLRLRLLKRLRKLLKKQLPRKLAYLRKSLHLRLRRSPLRPLCFRPSTPP
jgi:hypothetical protein